MGTYWDEFLKEYPQAIWLPIVVVLEAFWRYSNGDEEYARSMMSAAPEPDTRGPEVGELLKKIASEACGIMDDWTDPRSECREILRLVAEVEARMGGKE